MIQIGVSAFFLYPDPKRSVFSHKTIACLENDMAKYLYRPDVLPVLIPDLDDKSLETFLSQMDGFVLQGGVDIAPETYGHEPLDKKKWPGDAYRDKYELKILDFAFKNNKPVFGICRGCQLINVYFGGTLFQDLATETGSSHHRDAEKYDRIHHPITFSPGGLLDGLYKNRKNSEVNSVHHQGIQDLGKDLNIEAVSPDNLVEAVSHKKRASHFVLGVQWHPEFTPTLQNKLIPADPLYDLFLTEVARRKK